MGILGWFIGLFRFRQTNWTALLLCLIAAIVFWFFSALNKENTADIRLPILWETDASGLVATQPPPSYIEVNVTGKGWDLLAMDLNWRTEPAVIKIENPLRTSHLLTRNIRQDLADAAGSLRINYFQSDTIAFRFEKVTSRKLTVKPDLGSLSFREGYGITGPAFCEPGEVTVSGPTSVIRDMDRSHAVLVEKSDLDSPFEKKVKLRFDNPFVVAQPSEVLVTLPVGKVRTMTFRAMVLLDAPARTWRVMQDSSSITIELPEHAAGQFDRQNVRVTLSIRKPAADRFFMRGRVSGLPAEARVLASDSLEVYRTKK